MSKVGANSPSYYLMSTGVARQFVDDHSSIALRDGMQTRAACRLIGQASAPQQSARALRGSLRCHYNEREAT